MPHTLPITDPAKPGSIAANARERALDFLLGRINYERTLIVPYGQRQLKLDRMRQLLIRLGNPDAGLPIVHVAGTKGKGSTSALIAACLHAAGFDTGLYSSPHLERIEERFAVNGAACSAEELVALVDRVRPIVSAMDCEAAEAKDHSPSPTYFELTTALALMHFVERGVDAAVLEVGLGGRLDSTNVCQPAVTVITSISFDHTKQLGTTLAEIAAEKAGIIKPGVPVLCGPMDQEPRQVIAEIAQQHGCRLLESGRDFHYHYRPALHLDRKDQSGTLDFECQIGDEHLHLENIGLRLLGEHQAANAALALATIAELRRQDWAISLHAMRQGLGELVLPARVEIIRRKPTVVLDVAHNVASARALVEVLTTDFDCRERILLLAATRDKDVLGIVRTLVPHFSRVVVTQYQENPRAVPTATLGNMVRQALQELDDDHAATDVCEIPEPHKACRQALAMAKPEQLVCVTGSFFIAAELRRMLLATAK